MDSSLKKLDVKVKKEKSNVINIWKLEKIYYI